METAARDHDKHRSLSVTIRRHCQCAFQHSVPVRERHFLGSIREWPHRCLRPSDDRRTRRKRHRERHPVLGESPRDDLPCPQPFERSVDRRHIQRDSAHSVPRHLNRNILRTLIRHIKRGGLFPYIEYKRQLHARHLQLTCPRPGLRLKCHHRDRHQRQNHQNLSHNNCKL